MAAGALLIREAGGSIFKTNGAPYEIMNPKIVCAGTEELSKEVIEAIEKADALRLRME